MAAKMAVGTVAGHALVQTDRREAAREEAGVQTVSSALGPKALSPPVAPLPPVAHMK
jgi:hypothetical protein